MTEHKKDWFVVYTRPRSEKKVVQGLANKSIETFCPMRKTLRQWSDRKKMVTVPLFTSYLFVRISPFERDIIYSEPGIINFVHWQGKPANIRDQDIHAIRILIGEGKEPVIETINYLPGSEVRIVEGPLRGMIGVVDGEKKQKVIVRLLNLSCQVSAEVPTKSLALA